MHLSAGDRGRCLPGGERRVGHGGAAAVGFHDADGDIPRLFRPAEADGERLWRVAGQLGGQHRDAPAVPPLSGDHFAVDEQLDAARTAPV